MFMPRRSPSRVLSTTAAIALAITTFSAAPAFAQKSGTSGRSLLSAQLVGSMPAPASPLIAGVNPGGAPWVNGPSGSGVPSPSVSGKQCE